MPFPVMHKTAANENTRSNQGRSGNDLRLRTPTAESGASTEENTTTGSSPQMCNRTQPGEDSDGEPTLESPYTKESDRCVGKCAHQDEDEVDP